MKWGKLKVEMGRREKRLKNGRGAEDLLMDSYAETIAAAKRALEQRRADAAEAARQQLAIRQRADAQAREFLNSVVREEVDAARKELEAAGFRAEIGNGESADGLRCSLIVQGAKVNLVFLARADRDSNPEIVAEGIGGGRLKMDAGEVRARINKFLAWAISMQ